MNAKTEQKERSRQTILESAARLLHEKGISGARVADEMNGAALTVGGFYAHFSSKDELVDEALRRTGPSFATTSSHGSTRSPRRTGPRSS